MVYFGVVSPSVLVLAPPPNHLTSVSMGHAPDSVFPAQVVFYQPQPSLLKKREEFLSRPVLFSLLCALKVVLALLW